MPDEVFGFNVPKIVEHALRHRCPKCGDRTVEIIAYWKFEQDEREGMRPTGIYRCLSDSCDAYWCPMLPEIHG